MEHAGREQDMISSLDYPYVPHVFEIYTSSRYTYLGMSPFGHMAHRSRRHLALVAAWYWLTRCCFELSHDLLV